jgi:hypothetical protein
MRNIKTIALVSVAGALFAGCDLDVPDLNNPGLDDLEENPTRTSVSAACTGLVIGTRRNHAQANGFVAQLGILGREAYNFDQADPRFIGELLEGELNRGSPFGGNFWQLPYANIRLGHIILRAYDRVPDFSAEEKASIAGFVKTMHAYDLLEVIVTRDTNGAVIDTDRGLDEELAPIADRAAVFTEIARLLDEGATDLAAGGMEFPFGLSTGYAGFDTPPTFRRYNRALRARVAAYVEDYPTVLTALNESFINEAAQTVAELQVGIYHSYSTAPGDTVNNLINPNIFAHPSLEADAQMNDERFARKVAMADMPGSAQGLTSDIQFTIYTGPNADVPIIRNEELLLLASEARFFTGDFPGSLTAINTVRGISGGLTPYSSTMMEDVFLDRLLYERRYSLMFEWGHRLIDVRRFGRTDTLPLDAADHVRNIRYPIPLAECNARPDTEAACMLGST